MLDRLAARHASSRPQVLLLLGRFLQAFTQLAGSLRTCLTVRRETEPTTGSYTSFSSLEALLTEASCGMFSLWSSHLLAEMEQQLVNIGQQLVNSGQQRDLLAFFPAWDKISVQVPVYCLLHTVTFSYFNYRSLHSYLCYFSFTTVLPVSRSTYLDTFCGLLRIFRA